MMKAPRPENEAARLEALYRYQILDTDPEEGFDGITRLAAQICGAPIATVGFIDRDRHWLKSKVGWEADEIPRDLSLCAHAILQSDLLLVSDLLTDPRFALNPSVIAPPHLRFYAAVPLVTEEGFNIGTLSVQDRFPRELRPEEADALKILARQVVAQLDLRRKRASAGPGIPDRKGAERQLHESEERLKMVARATNDVIWDWNVNADTIWWNDAVQTCFGYLKEEVGEDPAWRVDRLHPDDRERVVSGIHAVIDEGESVWSDEYQFLRADGTYAVIFDRGHVVYDDAGKPIRMIGAMMDITQRKHAEKALQKSEAENRALIDAIPDLMFRISKDGLFLDLKGSKDFNLGMLTRECIGKKIWEIFPKEVAEQTMHYVSRALNMGGTQNFDYQLPAEGILRDYEARIVVSGNEQVLAIVREITERKAQAAVLEYQALHDSLTDLPNRTLLYDRLQQAILSGHRQNRLLALLLMDLDRFKDVNDTLGHHYGDTLLQQVGQRLRGALRESDTVARLGGDEFAILLSALADVKDVVLVAGKILQALEAPFILEGHILDIGASIGIALFPDHGEYADLLIQRADVAMYLAKEAGGGYAVYSSEQDQNSPRRLALRGELRHAIENGDLFLLYQPKIKLQTSHVIGVEALVRWRHPRLGIIPPDQFITLAEHTGLIKPLTLWVLNAALSQCAQWRQAGLELSVAVNLSARNLQDPQVPDQIRDLLETWKVDPSQLELEITESVIMADPARAMEILTRLSGMGVRLSIDDFGTGYSSLGYLKKLPVDEIKIDKSFVKEMATDGDDTVIVRSIIDLAHNLGLQVIAEGVEDQETWDALVILGSDAAQGYFMSRPIPADELTRWLRDSPWHLKST